MGFRGLLVALMALLAAGAAHAAPARQLAMQTIQHGGVSRTFGVYVPERADPASPAPVIIALHGRFSSAQAFHALSHLNEVADAQGAAVIYPQTVGGFWNDGGFEVLGRRETAQDDAGFIAAALETVSHQRAIDPARVFLVGYDAGGVMSYRLACDGPVRFAGVAIVGALPWDYETPACANARATPMLILHGERDEYFPTRGGSPGAPVTAARLSVDDALTLWSRINGCSGRPGRGGVYANCSGAPLAYVGLDRGTHDWFRDGDGYALNRLGVNASALIDGFFFDRANFAAPAPRGGGRQRSWIVYVPTTYDASKPTPAVILLHGRPGNAAGMAAITRMNAVAERRGFIAIYPEGLDNEWNAQFDLIGSDVRVGGMRSVLPQNDVEFLKTLTRDLGVDLNIDRRRMYVGGFSNGGFMTLRMACSAADTFAAFAEVGSELYTVMNQECRRGPPAPMLFMHGTGDPSIPYQGVVQRGVDGAESNLTLSVIATVTFFVNKNSCSASGASTEFAPRGQSPETRVVRFVPRDCAAGKDIEFWRIDNGGHVWPGVPGMLDEATFGKTNMDINAGEVIWDFFSRHELAQPAP